MNQHDQEALRSLHASVDSGIKLNSTQRLRYQYLIAEQAHFRAAVVAPGVGQGGGCELAPFSWEKSLAYVNGNLMFPIVRFGKYVLKRERVLEQVQEYIADQLFDESTTTPSVYLQCCRAMGKTSVLHLLVEHYKLQNYEVYYFMSAAAIPVGVDQAFASIAKDLNRKIVVLIDEVNTKPDHALFTELLKGSYPNVVIIGAAVAQYTQAGFGGSFRAVLRTTHLVLRDTDTDFKKLVSMLKSKEGCAKPELTEFICLYLLKHCAGHVYPTLRLIEHFLTDPDMKTTITNQTGFLEYFNSSSFNDSCIYARVRNRCYADFMLPETEQVCSRVLGGREELTDIHTLTRLGWWDEATKSFLSRFLIDTCLFNVERVTVSMQKFLHEGKSPEACTQEVIVNGLSEMDQEDFKCLFSSNKKTVKDSLSFNWARRVCALYPKVSVRSQESPASTYTGQVDYYINSKANHAIEFMRDAYQVGPEAASKAYIAQSMDGHLTRFTSGQYHWKNYVLFNFNMSTSGRGNHLVLPTDPQYHNKVYTYVHATNNLYCGQTLIAQKAVPNLPAAVATRDDSTTGEVDKEGVVLEAPYTSARKTPFRTSSFSNDVSCTNNSYGLVTAPDIEKHEAIYKASLEASNKWLAEQTPLTRK